MSLIIIDYGAGNIQSVKNALSRLGVESKLSSSREEILAADKVIFPGVGEASTAMSRLKDSGIDTIIPQIEVPLLGICLGMQLLCSSSGEGDVKGLGVFNAKVKKFNKDLKVPQIGWNQIEFMSDTLSSGIGKQEWVYFVHSYYAEICKDTSIKANYGIDFSAGLEKDNFFGTQFHPEKSGDVGERILKNFLNI
jgi:glutamine amidotransferase